MRNYVQWLNSQKEKHVLSIEILCSLEHCRQTDGASEIYYNTCLFITKLAIYLKEGWSRQKILKPLSKIE